jgi:membrane protease YdiL (CAAX protease family)
MAEDPAENIRLELAPIAKMVAVTALVAAMIVAIYRGLNSLPDLVAITRESPWMVSDLVHVPQFVVPLALIYVITKGRLATYGFNANQKPPLFTHTRMLGLGAAFGALMCFKYVPALVSGQPLDIPRPVTFLNVAGSLTFQWVVVGLSEETMFRGLIQTYLMRNLTGHVELVGHSLHVGAVVAAVIWGLFHFINILIMPAGPVVFTVMLTIVAGLLMGYAYQETGSLLTTVIVHNTIFGVPLAVGYLLYWLR